MGSALSRNNAIKFIILLGVVSLFADMTYEGSRSIVGPYLLFLGASGAAVGFVAGFGELIGYAFRFVSGYVSDKTGSYWTMTFLGYVINLLAVPLLVWVYLSLNLAVSDRESARQPKVRALRLPV